MSIRNSLNLALTLIREFCMLGERIGTIPRFFIILEGSHLETLVFDFFRVFVRQFSGVTPHSRFFILGYLI